MAAHSERHGPRHMARAILARAMWGSCGLGSSFVAMHGTAAPSRCALCVRYSAAFGDRESLEARLFAEAARVARHAREQREPRLTFHPAEQHVAPAI
ncbi:Uncharacterized protein TREMTM_C_00400 [Candidatus Tremblaya princeps]|uniref:Uncharacterized protein n=1 Tax=Tremblaya princeps TaxID=189385 RepID=A0A1C3K8Z3_TREPR|nr:Uncharacterized protein TREMTM_C_00400 [Candidatus Tremblaya princeps]